MPIKSKKKKSSFAEAASLADSLARDNAQIDENYSKETISAPSEEIIVEETITESKKKKGSMKKKKTISKRKKTVPTLVDVAKKEALEVKTSIVEKNISGDVSPVEKPFLGLRGGFFETFGGLLVVLIIIELIVILVLAAMMFLK